ncbi:MAG TPA: hypothetical protein VFY44_02190, partial [Thermoleophilaceae bacterium]|nr:hypothetical protein [Thermoleophilaceae bacterium]
DRVMRSHPNTHTHDVTVRLAHPGDAAALSDLASLDCADLPAGELMVAEAAGAIVAALPLAGGPAIADPFRRTAGLVSLLQLRRTQLGVATS